MTDQDKNEIAAIFTDILASYDRGCPNGIDAKTANTLRSLAEAFQTGRKTALKAFITLARSRGVPEEVIAEGRARIVEIMADALRFGVNWTELIEGASKA